MAETASSPPGQAADGGSAGDPQGRLLRQHLLAATNYWVGNAYRRQQVEVRVVGDTVEISTGGQVVRTHPARHDPTKAHGAFANPGGRPRRINAAS